MRVGKVFAFILFSLILLLRTRTVLLATNSQYENTIQEMADQIQQLTDQLNEATSSPLPTPQPPGTPKVKLVTPTSISVKSGSTTDITLTLKNIGSSYATNILTQASAADAPFSWTFLESSHTINSLSENSEQQVVLRLMTEKSAKAGTYSLTLTYSYRNDHKDNLSDTDTLTVKVTGGAAAANLSISGFNTDLPKIAPGDEFTLTAILENNGALPATNVSVSAEGFDAEKLYPADSVNSVYFREMPAADRQTLTYRIRVNGKAKSGSYPLVFKTKYSDSDSKEFTEETTYYVNVLSGASSTAKAQIQISHIVEPGGVYDVGQSFTFYLNLTNTGAQAAKNIKITAGSDSEGAVVPKSSNIQTIGELQVGASADISFAFSPTAKAVSQNYSVSFKVEYENGAMTDEDKSEIISFEQYGGVNIVNSKADLKEAEDAEKEEGAEAKVSQPKIIVSEYAPEPMLVKAGKQFDLRMVFQNTHSDKEISNVKATLSALETTEEKGSVFVPVETSNTFFFDVIPPKGTVERKMKMFAVPDAAPRTYTIQIKFTYEDKEFNKYEDSDTIGVNVKQVVELMTGEIVLPPTAIVGQPVYLSFNMSNTGKTSLQNLQAQIKGGFDTTGSQVYFGTLQQSGTTTYDGQFTIMEVGEYTGKVMIQYEDDTGELFEKEQEFTIAAEEMPMDMGMEFESEPPPGQGFLTFFQKPVGWAAIGGGLAFIIALVIFVRKRKLKRQQGLDDNE